MANKKQTTNTESAGEQATSGSTEAQGTNTAGGSAASSQTTSGQLTGQSSAGMSGSEQRNTSIETGRSTSMGTTSNAGGGSGAGTAAARSLYDQAKETAGQAYELAAEKATTKLDEKKTTLSDGLSSIAESVRMVGENLRGPEVQEGLSKYTSEYSGKAAEKIEGVANYFEQKSVREMYSDLESFARRNPLAFIGGAFALGLVAARFLKSGSPPRTAAAGAGFASEDTSRTASRFGSQDTGLNS